MSNEKIPTLRTDALQVAEAWQSDYDQMLEHARQLERELHEAKNNIAALQKIEADLRMALMDDSVSRQRDQWREVAERMAKCLNTAVCEWQGQGEKLTWQDTSKVLTAFQKLKEQEQGKMKTEKEWQKIGLSRPVTTAEIQLDAFKAGMRRAAAMEPSKRDFSNWSMQSSAAYKQGRAEFADAILAAAEQLTKEEM